MEEAKYYAEKILTAADKFLDKKLDSSIQSIMDKNEFNDQIFEEISEDIACLFEKWMNTKSKAIEEKSVIDVFAYFNSLGKINHLNIELAQYLISSDSLEYAAYKPFLKMAELMISYGFDWSIFLSNKIKEIVSELDQIDNINNNCYEELIFVLSKIFIICKVLKLKELSPNIIEACVAINEHSYSSDVPGYEARNSLLEIGQEYTDILYEKLRSLSHLNPICEQLMLCLAELGSKKKSEQLFKFFKEFFRKHQDKVFASDCLVRYNDSRAIVILRGYLERNLDCMDKNSFYELKSAVDKLGGQTKDIVNMYLSHLQQMKQNIKI